MIQPGMKRCDSRKLRHPSGRTVCVFRCGPHHWYADWSTETELEWIGGPKAANDFIARRQKEGYV